MDFHCKQSVTDACPGVTGPMRILPRRLGCHCGVSVVTAQVPSQTERIQDVAEQNPKEDQACALRRL